MSGFKPPFGEPTCRIPVFGEHCGNCQEPGEYLNWWGEPPEVGELIACEGCGAVHEIVEDGIRFTGDFDREEFSQ